MISIEFFGLVYGQNTIHTLKFEVVIQYSLVGVDTMGIAINP
jgi:hypothetical protein